MTWAPSSYVEPERQWGHSLWLLFLVVLGKMSRLGCSVHLATVKPGISPINRRHFAWKATTWVWYRSSLDFSMSLALVSLTKNSQPGSSVNVLAQHLTTAIIIHGSHGCHVCDLPSGLWGHALLWVLPPTWTLIPWPPGWLVGKLKGTNARSGTLRNFYDIINMHHMLKGMNTYNLMNSKIHLKT